MGRILFFLGLFLMLVGFIGVVFGVITVPQQIISTVSQATHPDVKSLCKPGEQLATEEGPEEYDTIQHLYNRSTTFYCVNNEGVQRDVTQQFADGFVQRLIGSFGSVIIPAISCILGTFGFIFTMFGGMFYLRRRAVSSVLALETNPAVVYQTRSANDSPLSAKFAQLEEARNSGLINEQEYQQKRREILGSMQ
jgi:hypothetical protein